MPIAGLHLASTDRRTCLDPDTPRFMYNFLIAGSMPLAHPGYFSENSNTLSGLVGRDYVLHLVLLYVRLPLSDQREKLSQLS